MPESFEISTVVPAPPGQVYHAWLDADEHAAMTGSAAACDAREGGRFTAGDGYIEGTNLELVPGRRIVQSWRTTEFADGDPDSRLEITLEHVPEGTKLTLRHSDIPYGQGDSYRDGWEEYYFQPMKEYFAAGRR